MQNLQLKKKDKSSNKTQRSFQKMQLSFRERSKEVEQKVSKPISLFASQQTFETDFKRMVISFPNCPNKRKPII